MWHDGNAKRLPIKRKFERRETIPTGANTVSLFFSNRDLVRGQKTRPSAYKDLRLPARVCLSTLSLESPFKQTRVVSFAVIQYNIIAIRAQAVVVETFYVRFCAI